MLKFHFDWLLIASPVLLLIFGLAILGSVAPNLVSQQTIIILVGLVLAGLIAWTDYRVLASFSWVFYFIAVGLLLATYVIGQTTRGSVRWIPLGIFNLQTSEIAKPLLIIFFASLCSKLDLSRFKNLLLLCGLLALPLFLIFRQPDLGSTLAVASLWLGIIFAAGAPWYFIVLGLFTALGFFPLFWNHLEPYQRLRLTSFLNPLSDPLKSGYNLLQSLIAVGSGQIWGRGLGHGTQSQLQFLPERHTDFIFASLAEELGLVGSLILLSLFSLLCYRLIIASLNASDRFGRLLALGVFSLITFQTFINIAMNLGLAPITGITLPLISFGGSSLVSTLISLGLALSVSLRRQKPTLFEIH